MGRKKKIDKSFAVQDPHSNVNPLDAAKVEKEFYDIFNYQRKQRNNLLGDFTGKEYKISPELVEELLFVPKKFDRFDNNLAYAATVLNNFVLNFKIEMEITPSFCTAKLFIIEIENGFDGEDTKHTTLLDTVTETYSFEFRDHVFEKWKVYYDEEIYDKNDILWKYLHLQSEEFLFNKEITEILSQLYMLRMLELLDTLGEEGEKVKYQFKLMMEKFLQTNPDLASNHTLQKMMLDKIMMENKTFASVLKTEEGKKVLNGYTTPLKNIRDKAYPTILEQHKSEKKVENKKTTAKTAKPKAKSKGGSSPVKPFIYDSSKVYSSKKEEKKAEPKKKILPGAFKIKRYETLKKTNKPPASTTNESKLSDEEALLMLQKKAEDTVNTLNIDLIEKQEGVPSVEKGDVSTTNLNQSTTNSELVNGKSAEPLTKQNEGQNVELSKQ